MGREQVMPGKVKADPLPPRTICAHPSGQIFQVLELRGSPGLELWTIVGVHGDIAAAEAAAGFHRASVLAWLVHDPTLGWIRRGGFTQQITVAEQFDEARAREAATRLPGMTLHVLRGDGRVTRPNLPAAPTG